MDAAYKLMIALHVDYETAKTLVGAGLRTENRAKAAPYGQLKKLVGKAAADKIKGK